MPRPHTKFLIVPGGWAIASHCRQENRSRTVWITFHWRGTTSSVSVTSSPSFDSFVEPQHGQLAGAATTTRSRGRCSGNGFRVGRLRSKDLTTVEGAVRSATSSSSVASASASANCISSWSTSRSLRSECTP